ncbi:hypothetical protein BD560DRAFT_396620 [Blakeslea trispora]|nr:hypothetical protein BD560DRAFT_396620 [Blakeslea trispora]
MSQISTHEEIRALMKSVSFLRSSVILLDLNYWRRIDWSTISFIVCTYTSMYRLLATDQGIKT